MYRVTTFAQQNRSLDYLSNSQTRIADLQNQIASGRKSLTYDGISRHTERLLTLESSHQRVSQYIAGNDLVERRLRTMEANVAGIFGLMSEFKTLLVDALNAQNAADLNMATQTNNMLAQIASLLNVEQDGRRLFAGARTLTEPVDLTSLPVTYAPFPTSDGQSSAYYQGDTQVMVVRADNAFDISYGVLASELGFERAIRSLDVVAKGVATDPAVLNHALAVATDALDDISNIRTRIGTMQNTLDEVNARHRDYLLFTEESITDIETVDVAEAVTRMQTAMTTLEASFMMISRLSQLTLMNFIR